MNQPQTVTYEQVNKFIDELISNYDKLFFSAGQRNIIHSIFTDFRRDEVKTVLKNIVEKHARAPSIAVIRQESMPFFNRVNDRRRQLARERLEKSGIRCDKCHNHGRFLAISKLQPNVDYYEFACPYCKTSRINGIGRNFPVWNDAMRKDFQPVAETSTSYNAAQVFKRKAAHRDGKQPNANLMHEMEQLAKSLLSFDSQHHGDSYYDDFD